MGNTCDPGRDRVWDVIEMFECVDRRSLDMEDDRWRLCRFAFASVFNWGRTDKLGEEAVCCGEVVDVMVAIRRAARRNPNAEKIVCQGFEQNARSRGCLLVRCQGQERGRPSLALRPPTDKRAQERGGAPSPNSDLQDNSNSNLLGTEGWRGWAWLSSLRATHDSSIGGRPSEGFAPRIGRDLRSGRLDSLK